MQRERRATPYPWSWEPAALAGITCLLAALLAVQIGRAVANLLSGSGWTWPQTTSASPFGKAFWTSMPDVLSGDAAAGLAQPVPDDLASPASLRLSLVVVEIVVLGAAVWVCVWAWRRWGSGRMLGMATVAEAEQILGVTRLRKVASIVRPDIHGHGHEPGQVLLEAGQSRSTEIGAGLFNPWLRENRRGRR